MKKIYMMLLSACLLLSMLAPSASALEYTIDPPSGPEYGKATSVEPIITADRGEMPNVDRSKNATLIPPRLGNPASYQTGSRETFPVTLTEAYSTDTSAPAYTSVTLDLYYNDGILGSLSIPSLGVWVDIYEGTDSAQLANGVGHFPGTSIWDGNVSIAGHNRGVNSYFGDIHKLTQGDIIVLTTKLGTRYYAVSSVFKVHETDTSMLNATAENCITLFTCVRNEPAYRWCVYGVEIV